VSTTTRCRNLIQILADEYGAGLGIFDPAAVLWAANRLADVNGTELAIAELSAANRVRERLGLPPAVAAYGDRLFGKGGRA
jgi:hypothetical protein